jgi:GDSL-like lipase/acylhydrolase family protein/HYR domain-containing protein
MCVRRHAHSQLAATIGLATVALLNVTCSNPTLPSKTIIIPPPAISCPVAPSPVSPTNGQSSLVTYGSATVTGGTPPVSVTCTPPSGSMFALGSTAVTCTASDAVRRTANCSFTVTVTLPPPRLGVTRILAFGDSITMGEVPLAGGFPAAIAFRVRPRNVEPDRSYPADLTTSLAQRYTAQGASRVDAFAVNLSDDSHLDCDLNPAPTTSGIVVIIAGCLGAHATYPETLKRLNKKIGTYHPDVMLLLIGVNDLDPRNPDASISAALQGVQALIACARANSIQVIVGTLLPEIAGDYRAGAVNLIVPFNIQLVPVATNAGARVVDLYSDIVMDVTDWIADDGLHPTEAGYQEMARVWFNNIQGAFDLPPSSTLPTRSGVRPNTIVRRALRR